MNAKMKVKCIRAVLDHPNNAKREINTLYVSQTTMAACCQIVGGEYGKTNLDVELDKLLKHANIWANLQRINDVFQELFHYMVHLEILIPNEKYIQ